MNLLSDDLAKFLDVEILDRESDATKLEFRFEQAPMNTRMRNFMRASFPMTDPKPMKFFIKIKSHDADRLDTAIEEFLAGLMLYLEEQPYFGEFSEFFRSTPIQVGHIHDNCIIMIQLNANPIGQQVEEQLGELMSFIEKFNAQATFSLTTATSFKDLMKPVELWLKLG